MWAELFLWNKENLISEIDQFDAALREMRNASWPMTGTSWKRCSACPPSAALPLTKSCRKNKGGTPPCPSRKDKRTKLLALLHIFEQKTDENHLLNVPQLVELLEQQGILAERKSIYSDIDTLCALGYDIQLRRGRGGGYYMTEAPFELAELKLLVDAVYASKFITARKSKILIDKLGQFTSTYRQEELDRKVLVSGRIKSTDEKILYTVDALHAAITAGEQVTFKYCDWNLQKRMAPRHDGQLYRVSRGCSCGRTAIII